MLFINFSVSTNTYKRNNTNSRVKHKAKKPKDNCNSNNDSDTKNFNNNNNNHNPLHNENGSRHVNNTRNTVFIFKMVLILTKNCKTRNLLKLDRSVGPK